MSELVRNWDHQIELANGDEVAAAIGILRCSQHAHRSWLDWIEAGGTVDHDEGALTDTEFHRRCIDEYERIIAVIERLAAARPVDVETGVREIAADDLAYWRGER